VDITWSTEEKQLAAPDALEEWLNAVKILDRQTYLLIDKPSDATFRRLSPTLLANAIFNIPEEALLRAKPRLS